MTFSGMISPLFSAARMWSMAHRRLVSLMSAPDAVPAIACRRFST
uniref:Uncharacterized protein n=1 Tax=Arundo donax TaxID=35708 RepID=A0A0A9EIN6_ARUDO